MRRRHIDSGVEWLSRNSRDHHTLFLNTRMERRLSLEGQSGVRHCGLMKMLLFYFLNLALLLRYRVGAGWSGASGSVGGSKGKPGVLCQVMALRDWSTDSRHNARLPVWCMRQMMYMNNFQV